MYLLFFIKLHLIISRAYLVKQTTLVGQTATAITLPGFYKSTGQIKTATRFGVLLLTLARAATVILLPVMMQFGHTTDLLVDPA